MRFQKKAYQPAHQPSQMNIIGLTEIGDQAANSLREKAAYRYRRNES